jgi:hypothetical protein
MNSKEDSTRGRYLLQSPLGKGRRDFLEVGVLKEPSAELN